MHAWDIQLRSSVRCVGFENAKQHSLGSVFIILENQGLHLLSFRGNNKGK